MHRSGKQPFARNEDITQMHRPRAAGGKADKLWRAIDSHAWRLSRQRHKNLAAVGKRRAEDNVLGKLSARDPWRITLEYKATVALFRPQHGTRATMALY